MSLLMGNRIYLSFWHLCLDNLPQGRFERRTIQASDARAMINAARTDKTLLCVSKDDLLAPYRAKERRRHEELCALLSASYDCHLSLKDFLTEVDDEENPLQTIVPLQVVELQPGDWHAAAVGDPDAQPLTADDFARMKRTPQVRVIRRALGLSQEEFAEKFHIPIGTLRDWEQGRKVPDTAARAYLRVISHNPAAVTQALSLKP